MDRRALLMNEKDNVITVIDATCAGETVWVFRKDGVRVGELRALEGCERYHKLALSDIASAELVLKYGQVIGRATQVIRRGEHVHVHNIESVKTND